MLIKRRVFEELAPHVPTYRVSSFFDPEKGEYAKPQTHEFFATSIDDSGALLSEDYHFFELLRKHGGKDALSNLIALCSPCHNIAPESVHQNPRDSYENGWLVPSWADPSEWPMTTPNGSRVLLDDDGGTRIVEGREHGW
jgi:hypothetical protein